MHPECIQAFNAIDLMLLSERVVINLSPLLENKRRKLCKTAHCVKPNCDCGIFADEDLRETEREREKQAVISVAPTTRTNSNESFSSDQQPNKSGVFFSFQCAYAR